MSDPADPDSQPVWPADPEALLAAGFLCALVGIWVVANILFTCVGFVCLLFHEMPVHVFCRFSEWVDYSLLIDS